MRDVKEILLIVRAGRRGLHMFQKTLNIEGMLSTTARDRGGGGGRGGADVRGPVLYFGTRYRVRAYGLGFSVLRVRHRWRQMKGLRLRSQVQIPSFSNVSGYTWCTNRLILPGLVQGLG